MEAFSYFSLMENSREQQIADIIQKMEALDAQQRNIQLQLMQLKLAVTKLQSHQPISEAAPIKLSKKDDSAAFSLEQFIGLKLASLYYLLVL
jgi:hypothetical protein